MTKKEAWKTLAFVISLFLFVGVYTLYRNYVFESYQAGFKLKFSGIVDTTIHLYKEPYIVYLNNVDPEINYDEKDSVDYSYRFVLKNGKAEILCSFYEKILKNDSIYVNGVERQMYLYRKNVLIDKDELNIRVNYDYDELKPFRKL
ncbi:MAG: hypothetical protein JWP12_1088 [Bacteroidetes bacterium]|nr:hypothetical protein [Bacteroidota bacterium]